MKTSPIRRLTAAAAVAAVAAGATLGIAASPAGAERSEACLFLSDVAIIQLNALTSNTSGWDQFWYLTSYVGATLPDQESLGC